jgi:stage II sporulation protein D
VSRRRQGRRVASCAIAVALAFAARGAHAAAADLLVFSLEQGRLSVPAGAPDGALATGSLTKPFVARAWARAHPGAPPPVVRCDATSRCWNVSGHGTLGLVRATALSCNTYFRALAADTPSELLVATLREAGFLLPDPLTPETAIGLPTDTGRVVAEPEAILRAYVTLLREPWDRAETVRREVLAGLRDSAREGTAAGLAELGFHAKTGTAPAIDGHPLASSGWAVAVDETGRAHLALLTPGTGREAARGQARWLRGEPPAMSSERQSPLAGAGGIPTQLTGQTPAVDRRSQPASGRVRVTLFGALAPRRVLALNLGSAPIAASRGFVGPGASLALQPGDRLADGDWQLSLPAVGLQRILRGRIRVDAAPREVLRIQAEIEPIEYVAGVIAAELGTGEDVRRVPLGAAVLRFLAAGPRHADADVCDLTHCAWFLGRGPHPTWPSPRAVILERPGQAIADVPIEIATWRRMVEAAREQGPDRWTSHCGGAPLSMHRVWGGGDTTVFRCERHGPADSAPWVRHWSTRDVERAFGGPVGDLRLVDEDGRWRLERTREGATFRLSWDEAHARLASVLGWGALPSPADRITRETDGFRVEGRGLGHRVGLCLGSEPKSGLLD